MSNRVFIPEVSHAIEEYFERVGLTQVMAAHLLGVTPQAVSLQLRQPFGKNVSAKWEKAFGFNREFLMTGEGELISSDKEFTPAEKAIHESASKELGLIKEIEKENKALAQDGSKNDELAQKEDDMYRKIDLDDFVYNTHWDSTKDYESAFTLVEAVRVKISDLEAELEYYIREHQKLVEENKNLFIENSALRRIGRRK